MKQDKTLINRLTEYSALSELFTVYNAKELLKLNFHVLVIH
jgi:hypothetical protein